MPENNTILLRQLIKWLGIILLFAIVGELIFFPSLQNFLGCIMASVSYWTYIYFLKRKYILMYPFSFLMFTSMFLYRYLPLIATIFEFKPITYGFERPVETFVYEIILYLFSWVSFYWACSEKEVTNNCIQKTLFKMGFFDINKEIVWILGIVGLLIRLYNFSAGDVEYGDSAGKFLLGLDYLMYAPLTLFFPQFLNIKKSKNLILIFYTVFIFILNIASNSRRQIIIPIAIYVLLFFLYAIKNNIDISKKISTVKIVFLIVFSVYGLNVLTDLSLAMLSTRSIRKNISKKELFNKTLETYQDKDLMKKLRSNNITAATNSLDYSKGWTEDYIDNFLLNRYANMRITDETLYYAQKKGYNNPKMKKDMEENLLLLLPTPLLKILGFHLDKSEHEFSRGDFLYGKGLGGFRVTSHVGDGLATFGYWYFFLQFFIFFLVFKLLNCLVFFSKFKIIYSSFGLFNVFTFLGMFRNANGITLDLSYCLRGFWQGCVTYLILFFVIKKLVTVFKQITN